MNIYLVSRTDDVDYDEHDAFVVVANDPKEAKLFLDKRYNSGEHFNTWSDKVKTKLIGTTTKYSETTEILGSFNAG